MRILVKIARRSRRFVRTHFDLLLSVAVLTITFILLWFSTDLHLHTNEIHVQNKRPGSADAMQRRRKADYSWINESGMIVRKSPVYGIFVLVDIEAAYVDDNVTIAPSDREFGLPTMCGQIAVDLFHVYLFLAHYEKPRHDDEDDYDDEENRAIDADNDMKVTAKQLAMKKIVAYVNAQAAALSSQGCQTNVHQQDFNLQYSYHWSNYLNEMIMKAYLNDGVDNYLLVLTQTTVATRPMSVVDLAAIFRRHSDPEDTGILLVEPSPERDVNRVSNRFVSRHERAPLAVFFTRVHVDIFGAFIPWLNSAVALVIAVYDAANLTLHVNEIGARVMDRTSSRHQVMSSWGSSGQWVGTFDDYSDTLRRYLATLTSTPCFRCLPSATRVISISLYGKAPSYAEGAVRNAQLAPVTFPGWRLRFYCSSRSELAPPQTTLWRLRELGAEVLDVDERSRLPPMLWRFTVVDDGDVDVFIVRDADARLTARDAAAVADWLRQEPEASVFHCMRDHPSHSENIVLGGLWGARRAAFSRIFSGSFLSAMKPLSDKYMDDMLFLNEFVWPRVLHVAYCHDSFTCRTMPASHRFPVHRVGHMHVGAKNSAYDTPHYGHLALIRLTGIVADCVPLLTAAQSAAYAAQQSASVALSVTFVNVIFMHLSRTFSC